MTTTVPESPKTDEDTVTLTIDGQSVEAAKGELLITAAQRAGVFIPRFCYHDRLKPVGMCRMCLVEIEGVRGLPPACTTPLTDGMVVHFKKDNVDKAQDGVLEFLLINHPLDCPVCDRGGECPLQDQTLSFGPGESRFVEEKRHWEKPIEISDHVLLDRERCIQCSRCTRFADDVAGDPLITFVERGGQTEVNTFPGDPFASYFSGNIVQICPVGALTAEPYRFNARPWDLVSNETTCSGCSIGCKGVAQSSRNEMVRFLGVDSQAINQGWLCDNGRYGFDFMQSPDRIRSPFILDGGKQQDTHLNTALDAAASVIAEAIAQHGPESIAFLGGAHGTNEDAYAISRLAKGVIGTSLVDSQLGNSLPADLVLSSRRARISDIDNAAAIITLGIDIKESLPLVFLRARKAFTENSIPLIDVNSFPAATKKMSTHHIDLVPGDEKQSERLIREAIQNLESHPEPTGGSPERSEGASEGSHKASNGKIILIAGDINTAQDRGTFSELVQSLLISENVYLLPAVTTSNMHGAYEMGLAPGLLPGRVADTSVSNVGTWPRVPTKVGAHSQSDTTSILRKAASGDVKVLILVGANPVAHFPDATLAQQALENCENIIALDAFLNESTQHADIFIPTTVANEKDGTVTNIEGRVQRVVQIVAPQGNVFDDWKIADLLSERLDSPTTFETVEDITNEIARVAPSFAHITTTVLSRARDGAIVPIDDNKDALVGSQAPLVQTPSWEPIASRAAADEDPVEELDHEEHHPSANIIYSAMITSAFERESAHAHHLDQYALRLVFIDSFHGPSTLKMNSGALAPVVSAQLNDVVRMHPKDLESISVRDDNLVRLVNDNGTVDIRVVPDKNMMRGIALATMTSSHPLRALVRADVSVTDLRVEGK